MTGRQKKLLSALKVCGDLTLDALVRWDDPEAQVEHTHGELTHLAQTGLAQRVGGGGLFEGPDLDAKWTITAKGRRKLANQCPIVGG